MLPVAALPESVGGAAASPEPHPSMPCTSTCFWHITPLQSMILLTPQVQTSKVTRCDSLLIEIVLSNEVSEEYMRCNSEIRLNGSASTAGTCRHPFFHNHYASRHTIRLTWYPSLHFSLPPFLATTISRCHLSLPSSLNRSTLPRMDNPDYLSKYK
jgi:hypothetical protein